MRCSECGMNITRWVWAEHYQARTAELANRCVQKDARIVDLEKTARINADEMAQARQRIAELEAELTATVKDRDSWREQSRTNKIAEVQAEEALAERTQERDELQKRVDLRLRIGAELAEKEAERATLAKRVHDQRAEIVRLEEERDALAAKMIEVVLWWNEDDNSDFDLGSDPQSFLAARLAAERKAERLDVLREMASEEPRNDPPPPCRGWCKACDLDRQIERGESE